MNSDIRINADQDRLPTVLIIPLIQLFAVVFLFIALLNDQRELTILILVILAILIGAKIWRRLSLAGISCESLLNRQRVFPGETLTYSTRVRNAKLLPVLAEISASFTDALQSAENPPDLNKSCSLFWYQEADFKWPLTAMRRGVYRLGPMDLKVGDLFGFYTQRSDALAPMEVIVYPRLIPLKPLCLPKLDLFGNPGAKSPIEDPVYVYGTRDYQSGRPARYIHWKASARLARLQEKICEPAAQEKILLMVDVTGFLKIRANAQFEKIIEVAASLAVGLDRSGFAVGLVTNGILNGGGSPVLPIARGAQQIANILETLARLQMTPAADLTDTIRRGFKLPWGTTGVSLSCDFGKPCQKISAFFKYRRVPVGSVVARPAVASGSDQYRQPANVLTVEDICLEGIAQIE